MRRDASLSRCIGVSIASVLAVGAIGLLLAPFMMERALDVWMSYEDRVYRWRHRKEELRG